MDQEAFKLQKVQSSSTCPPHDQDQISSQRSQQVLQERNMNSNMQVKIANNMDKLMNKFSENEKDLLSDYQRRVNESLQKQNQMSSNNNSKVHERNSLHIYQIQPQRILNPVVFNSSNQSKIQICNDLMFLATPLGKTIEKDEENIMRNPLQTTQEGIESTASLKQNLFNNRLMMDFAFSDKKSQIDNQNGKNNNHEESIALSTQNFNLDNYNSYQVGGGHLQNLPFKQNRDLLDFNNNQAYSSQRTGDQQVKQSSQYTLYQNNSNANLYGTQYSSNSANTSMSKGFTYNYNPFQNQQQNIHVQHQQLKPLHKDFGSTQKLREENSQETIRSPYKQNFSLGNLATYDNQRSDLVEQQNEQNKYQSLYNLTQTDDEASSNQIEQKQNKENKTPKITQTSARSQKQNLQNINSSRMSKPPQKSQAVKNSKQSGQTKTKTQQKDKVQDQTTQQQKCCDDREVKETKFLKKNSEQRKMSKYVAVNSSFRGIKFTPKSQQQTFQKGQVTAQKSAKKRSSIQHQNNTTDRKTSRSKSRQRSKSLDFSRSFDNQQSKSKAFRQAQKILTDNYLTNQSVKNSQQQQPSILFDAEDRNEFIRRVYQNSNRNVKLNDQQRSHIRQLSSGKERAISKSNSLIVNSSSKTKVNDKTKRSARDSIQRRSRGPSYDSKIPRQRRSNSKSGNRVCKTDNSMIMAMSQDDCCDHSAKNKKSEKPPTNHDLIFQDKDNHQKDNLTTDPHDHKKMLGGVLNNIEKLLQLLRDHCKVCPEFAQEFEKLYL